MELRGNGGQTMRRAMGHIPCACDWPAGLGGIANVSSFGILFKTREPPVQLVAVAGVAYKRSEDLTVCVARRGYVVLPAGHSTRPPHTREAALRRWVCAPEQFNTRAAPHLRS